MTPIRWAFPGLAVMAAAATMMLWPMHGNGLSGTALHPHYRDFGWFSYAPLPDQPTPSDLRAAGVTLPRDLVATRRHQAGAVAAGGLVLAVAGAVASARRHAH